MSTPIPLPTKEQMIAALQAVPLLAGLEQPQIARLAQHVVARRAEPDQLIFVEGDDCQGLYVVYSGAIRIFKQSPQGREQVLTVERAGGIVAELPVFDGGPYPASCKPLEQSVLLFISKQDFRRSCQQDPELALKVLASVGARLRRLVMIIEELSFLTVRSRLAALLLELAREAGVPPSAGAAVTSPPERKRSGSDRSPAPFRLRLTLTQQEIAARIGTVRELVSRNLGRLQAEGIVHLDGHELVIDDLPRLEQEAVATE
jgi:CRP/FNR family transcriptional regulator